MKKILACVLTLGLAAGLITGCSSSSNSSKVETKKIKIGYVNWSEGIAMTNLAAAILENKLGYDVDMVLADVAPVFTSLASGNTDLFLDTWLPVTHKEYMDKYGKDIVDMGVEYENAGIGLVVPSYVEIDSIDQLNDKKDEFGGKIIGIDSGAGIMNATESTIDKYGLNYQLVSGSGPAMTASLKKAIDNKEPIVVTGWTPHWMFARWDLKILKDPQGIYGDAENIHAYSRKGFEEDMPGAAEFIKNFKLSDEQLSDLMAKIEDSKAEPIETAKKWMDENEDLVNTWIGKQ
ncbi:glycine betaine ABC transporter substrate-binding protein [Lacrimispora sp. 38-1]|uniref:glycine betaine ABC transporter substrate-binding protein n=1 Tax=Lacrimispora sp. 38-1 TaxID=3125778 RepID=UPI003CFACF5A